MLKRIRELLAKRKKTEATGRPATDGRSAGATATAAAPAARPPVKRGPTVAHRPISEADLDPDAVKIVRRLTRFDHRAYLVGGCVRDLLLDRKPKDFDVGTSATPRQMKRLFRNCRIIGRRFRLAHIYFQHGKIIEVATFRARDVDDTADAKGKDLLIREDNVFGTPEEDALRRDFTINALFYDVTKGNVIDHADGLGDLRQRLVRTIGDPAIRFREDPVRILRAIKFAARLDFKIEKRTLAALQQASREIEKAASPRVLEEIARFGREGAARRSFELLRDTRVLETILPEVAAACAAESKAWDLLLRLLERTDRERRRDERPIRVGETFTLLVLPMLARPLGWRDDGSVDPPAGIDPRAVVEEALRPMALRLRVPRREQEYCRQLISALHRVVSGRRMRAGARRAIQARDYYPDLLWILSVLADGYGGAFRSAAEAWSGREPLTEAKQAGQGPGPASRRPRKRRGSRGRRPAATRQEGGRAVEGSRQRQGRAQQESAGRRARRKGADQATKPEAGMPSPWDDDYFFAALPSLPDDGSEGPPTRPNGREASQEGAKPEAAPRREPRAAAPTEEPRATAPTEESRAAAPRKRRRRRKRRKKTGSAAEPTAAGKGQAKDRSAAGHENGKDE
jgi:poly(A) polymerase